MVPTVKCLNYNYILKLPLLWEKLRIIRYESNMIALRNWHQRLYHVFHACSKRYVLSHLALMCKNCFWNRNESDTKLWLIEKKNASKILHANCMEKPHTAFGMASCGLRIEICAWMRIDEENKKKIRIVIEPFLLLIQKITIWSAPHANPNQTVLVTRTRWGALLLLLWHFL